MGINKSKFKEFHTKMVNEYYIPENNNIDKTIGFIILRKVIDNNTANYWKKSYECIRKFYPENNIIIIDDNSNNNFIDINYQKSLYKVKIINSEYPNRGELLPYYYYLHNKIFDIAVIIHDSVFINSKQDFKTDSYKILWQFEHLYDQYNHESNLIRTLNNHEELLLFYKCKRLWKGCFGGMAVVSYDYLKHLDNIYDIKRLLPHIHNRYDRMCFERIIACILQKHQTKECMFGDIFGYHGTWGINFHQLNSFWHLPIIKVWTGR